MRHNLDVMHIEKNICDSVMGTVLDIDKKSKDSLNARLDLKMMGIRKELHPEDGKTTFLVLVIHSQKVRKMLCFRGCKM